MRLLPESAVAEVAVREQVLHREERPAEDSRPPRLGPDFTLGALKAPAEEVGVPLFDDIRVQPLHGVAEAGVVQPVGVVQHVSDPVRAGAGVGEIDITSRYRVDPLRHACPSGRRA